MAVNIQKEKIQMEYLVAQESIEKIIETRISIPDHRPKIERVFDLLGRIEEVKGLIVEDGVEITGGLFLTLIYKGLEEETFSPLFVREREDFDLFFSIQRALSGMDLLLDASIVELNFGKKGDGDVEVLLSLKVSIKVLEKRCLSFITGIEGLEREATVAQEEVFLEEFLEEGREIFEFNQELSVADLEEIHHYEARILSLQEEQENGRVVLSGEIEFSLIYGQKDEIPLVLHEVFDFSKELALIHSSSVGRLQNLTELIKTEVDLISPGCIEVNILLDILVKVVKQGSYQFLTGIESKRVDVQQDSMSLESVVDVNRVMNHAVFNCNLPAERGDLGKILFSQASLRECITESTSGGAKITGHVEGTILYSTKEEDEDEVVLDLLNDSFVFEHFIPLSQAREEMMAHTTLYLRGLEAKILNDRTLELSMNFDEMVRVTWTRDLMVITDLVVVSSILEGSMVPSMVLYVIKPEDTLWKIARRFGARREDILKDNQEKIGDPESLVVGEKIFIRRHHIGSHQKEYSLE